VAQVTTVPAAPPLVSRPSWLSDFKLGGYGSTRFEANDLNKFSDTFTFRRFVLTGDATIAERLRSVVEIEFERLTELEVERRQPVEGGQRGFSQSIEGSDKSEGLARAGLDAVRPGRLAALPGRHDAGAARPLQYQPR